MGDTFLDIVTQEIGTPYVYGGDTPAGFDCSGLVQWAAGKAGLPNMPRTASQQLHYGLATSSPQAGDLVFFKNDPTSGYEADHVGICADTGCSEMIDAPHTGALVRRESVQGFGTIVGYRVIGAGGSGPQDLQGQIAGALNDVTDNLDPLAAVSQLIASLPAELLKVLLGGHTLPELALRAVEIVGGALVLATGAVTLLLVIAHGGGEPARAARGVRRSSRSVGRSVARPARAAQQATRPERAPRSRTRDDRRRLDALLRAERSSGDAASSAGEL